jgi:hypothetical protein
MLIAALKIRPVLSLIFIPPYIRPIKQIQFIFTSKSIWIYENWNTLWHEALLLGNLPKGHTASTIVLDIKLSTSDYPKYGGNLLQNVGNKSPSNTASCPRILQSLSTTP